jgi:ribose/xylose/arabinose/galactoside ABC-type transport system permease subunit
MPKLLITLGILLVLIGLALGYAPWLFSWFGKLPGDIRIERENGVFFFPITSMLLISVVISLLLTLFFKR